MRGYELSMAEGRSEAYDGTVAVIYKSTHALVNSLLGPGLLFPVLLTVASVVDALIYVSLASTGSALILSTISSDTGRRSIEEMTGSLGLFALAVATVSILKHFLTHHAGAWLVNRAKFAIGKIPEQLSEKQEEDVMAHLGVVKHMYVNERYEIFTGYCTELFAIIGIGKFSFWVGTSHTLLSQQARVRDTNTHSFPPHSFHSTFPPHPTNTHSTLYCRHDRSEPNGLRPRPVLHLARPYSP